MAHGLLLDSNLCILYAVGLTNLGYIARHKRLRNVFDVMDFDALHEHVSRSSTIIFTPHVLTEASNLIRYMNDPARSEVAGTLARTIAATEERPIRSDVATRRGECIRLGLTDAVLLELASSNGTLLTVDLALYVAAIEAGYSAINYNYERERRPGYR